MAPISLRSYNKEIQKLIDNGQIEEAIAHCQHILQSFTKHIETYRLLGKAYLESQQYSEAMDIFQRVLSSVPDDFVSHVGMSIVREDEGNLNEALWHMERAFEVQPANNAIQSELKRLYGLRDGFEPPRIRLTRGALARMYVRGDLYQQAIAEIRAALSEDLSRIDLELLLATVYFKSNHAAEAVETANTILNKLPFCLQANSIINQIYTQTNRLEEAQPYRLKLESLDPYTAYITPANPSVDQVPDNSVSIEPLSWNSPVPEVTSTDATEWMPLPQGKSNGEFEIKTIEEERSVLPEWLRSTVEISEIPPQGEMPKWLKAAGWIAATETVNAATLEADESAISEIQNSELTEEEINQAEIPDWLLEVAPTAEAFDTQQVIAAELGTIAATDSITTGQPEVEATEILEERLKESEPTLEEFNLLESRYEEPLAEQIPDDISTQWLSESELDQLNASVEIEEPRPLTDLTTPPEWIQGNAQSGDKNTTQLPDWLKELTAEESSQPSEVASPVVSQTERTSPSVEEGLVSTPSSEVKEKTDVANESFVVNAPIQEIDKLETGEVFVSSKAEDLPEEITEARNDFQQGRLEEAYYKYSQLIKSQMFLSTIILDLQEIVKKYPEDAKSWQNLGDAYLRNHQIKEAMEAYSQAEKLIS